MLSDKGIKLDRKILAALALERPDAFARVVDQVK
jgi:ribosomal protein L20